MIRLPHLYVGGGIMGERVLFQLMPYRKRDIISVYYMEALQVKAMGWRLSDSSATNTSCGLSDAFHGIVDETSYDEDGK